MQGFWKKPGLGEVGIGIEWWGTACIGGEYLTADARRYAPIQSGRGLYRLNLFVFRAVGLQSIPQAHIRLQAEPELRGSIEKARQAKGRVRSDGPLAPQNFAQAHPGDAQSLRQFFLLKVQRL